MGKCSNLKIFHKSHCLLETKTSQMIDYQANIVSCRLKSTTVAKLGLQRTCVAIWTQNYWRRLSVGHMDDRLDTKALDQYAVAFQKLFEQLQRNLSGLHMICSCEYLSFFAPISHRIFLHRCVCLGETLSYTMLAEKQVFSQQDLHFVCGRNLALWKINDWCTNSFMEEIAVSLPWRTTFVFEIRNLLMITCHVFEAFENIFKYLSKLFNCLSAFRWQHRERLRHIRKSFCFITQITCGLKFIGLSCAASCYRQRVVWFFLFVHVWCKTHETTRTMHKLSLSFF